MKRNLIELQHSQLTRTVAQLNTLIHESEMVCTILAISPQNSAELSSASHYFNALIVHDHEWYLLRSGPIKLLQYLRPSIEKAHRVFFISSFINDLSNIDVEPAADYLVSLQPCLLCQSNSEALYSLANPYQGFIPTHADQASNNRLM
ncbi:hypothetical protein NT239_14465 [Chitinibacter sp. SCUT-21]|uniref:hypothetical protein n=1 Tax=Chitinibacter sp. SCUT-21 TaxID=2970891 RepID=UPI0035A70D8B